MKTGQQIAKDLVKAFNADVTEQELKNIGIMAQRELDMGWLESDVWRFHSFSEEIRPQLNEDYALKKMHDISVKYPHKIKE